MRGLRAIAGSLPCLLAGCSFTSPTHVMTSDANAGANAPSCMTAATYTPAPVTERRYRYIPESVNYDTAIDLCAADGAHLAVIDDLAENAHVRTLGGGDLWIGFDDLAEEQTFRSVTGSTGTFTHWAPGDPNNNQNEDCAHLRDDGLWNDDGAQEMKHPVCECDPAYRPPPTPACRKAADGFATFYGRRYFLRNEPRTWRDAQADCASIGAHVFVHVDDSEAYAVGFTFNPPFWIGLTDEAAEGTFRWVNGSPSTYERFQGDPPMDEGEDCVIVDGAMWSNVSCAGMYKYACECDPAPP